MASTDKKVGYVPTGKRPDYTPETAADGVEGALQMLEGRWKMTILFHLFGGSLLRWLDEEAAMKAIRQAETPDNVSKLPSSRPAG